MTEFHIPDSEPDDVPNDPLAQFQTVFRALEQRRGWFESTEALRFSALILASADRDPEQVADWIRAAADFLDSEAGWFGTLNSPLRFAIAAVLYRERIEPPAYLRETVSANELFEKHSLESDCLESYIAQLILQVRDPEHAISEDAVWRFSEIISKMESHHPWLTGVDDYPACALLVGEEAPVVDLTRQIESAYRELSESGFSEGDDLQLCSHLLYLTQSDVGDAVRRFVALYNEFETRGFSIGQQDYNELATLTALPASPERIVERVADHVDELSTMEEAPAKDVAFSLACGTTFMALASPESADAGLADLQALGELRRIVVAARTAAAVNAASAATV